MYPFLRYSSGPEKIAVQESSLYVWERDRDAQML